MPKIKSRRLFIVVIIGISVIAFASNAIINYFKPTGMVEANVIRVTENTIILGNNCTAIIAQTSPERAYSIQLGLEKKIEERPNTHDSMVAVLKAFNITLDYVQIDRYDGDYYYSSAFFNDGDKVLKLDMRPSDAIAIALRTDSKIYINQTILSEVGRNICL